MIARRAGDFLESQRYIGLGPEVELHVGIDRKRVEALLAEPSPISVRSHESFINGEAGLFADGAGDCVQAPFNFLLRKRYHNEERIFLV